MTKLSPKSHLYRLGILLAVFFVAAAAVRQWATPASWNYRDWYRMDAIELTAREPLAFGGNESCASCHEKADQTMAKRRHKGLSCESCHGAFADHVKADKAFATAKVDKSPGQCLNCHAADVNKPQAFPQFSRAGAIGKLVKEHKEMSEGGRCSRCHEAHDPKTADEALEKGTSQESDSFTIK